MFCTFSLRNRLRATTACNFSSLIWPAGSAPAALASLLFDPPGPQITGKTQCFATFLPFRAPASSSDLFSSDSSPCWLLFHLSMLSEVWLLNFLRLDGCVWTPCNQPCCWMFLRFELTYRLFSSSVFSVVFIHCNFRRLSKFVKATSWFFYSFLLHSS